MQNNSYKFIYRQQKFKFTIKDPNIQFSEVKQKLIPVLKSLGHDVQLENLSLKDKEGSQFLDNELLIDHQDAKQDFIYVEEKVNFDLIAFQEDNYVPEEAIVVIYDQSGSMVTKFTDNLTRIGAVFAFFSAFTDRTTAMELKNIVSLYLFDSTIQKKCPFMKDMDLFLELVDDAKPSGQTLLYDALQTAINDLVEIQTLYPDIILRIIALTDGEDKGSQSDPQKIANQIVKNGIILDSFVVGENCIGLKTITHCSGGKCYKPADLNEGISLFQVETIVSAKARGVQKVKNNDKQEAPDLKTLEDKEFDKAAISVDVQEDVEANVMNAADLINKIKTEQAEKGNIKRIVKELTLQMGADQNKNLMIFPQSENYCKWKVLLIGPEGTVYNRGVYLIFIDFQAEYPKKAPKVRFITPIYHCNLTDQGTMCRDFLGDKWKVDYTMKVFFDDIFNLLKNPNSNDAVDQNIAALMLENKDEYNKKALEHTLKNANKPIKDLLKDILGESVKQDDEAYKTKKEEIEKWIEEVKFKEQAQ